MRQIEMRSTATALGLVTLLASGSTLAAVEWAFRGGHQDGNLEFTERELMTGAPEFGPYHDRDTGSDNLLDEDYGTGGHDPLIACSCSRSR
jgi:hypothetical protein